MSGRYDLDRVACKIRDDLNPVKNVRKSIGPIESGVDQTAEWDIFEHTEMDTSNGITGFTNLAVTNFRLT